MTDQESEMEANIFAMCLLMPEDFVRNEIQKFKPSFDLCNDLHMKKLADKFKVSVPMMAYRIGQIQSRI